MPVVDPAAWGDGSMFLAADKTACWRRLLARALRGIAVLILGFLAVLYAIQDRMIFPGTESQGRPEAVVRPRPGTELVTLATPQGERVAALFGPALQPDGSPLPEPMSRRALLYFYGNAMCLACSDPEFERFRRLGLNVLIPDYLGFGMSSGKASEQGCRQTAEACYEWLMRRGFPADRILVGGWSLGGAVAIDLANRHPVGGLIAFSTFTSTRDMSRSIVPLPLPPFLFAHKFDSLSKMPHITCPVLLGHGRRDTLVPFAMCGRLAAAASTSPSCFVIENAEHNDFYEIGGPQIDEAVRRFLEKLPG